MKCLYNLLTLLFVFSGPLIAHSQMPYLIKSAKITYTFSNGIQTGTKTLVFKDSGAVEKQEVFAEADTVKTSLLLDSLGGLHIPAKSHSGAIQTMDSVFTINYDSKTFSCQPRLNAFGLIAGRRKKVGEQVFLGRKCEIYDIYGFKTWMWNGICLKKEIDIPGGEFYEYATLIEDDYVPGNNEFDIPKEMKLL